MFLGRRRTAPDGFGDSAVFLAIASWLFAVFAPLLFS
jgi:hypothetical protein